MRQPHAYTHLGWTFSADATRTPPHDVTDAQIEAQLAEDEAYLAEASAFIARWNARLITLLVMALCVVAAIHLGRAFPPFWPAMAAWFAISLFAAALWWAFKRTQPKD